jgi:hypothetical protein
VWGVAMDSHSAGPSEHGYYCPPIPAYFSEAVSKNVVLIMGEANAGPKNHTVRVREG